MRLIPKPICDGRIFVITGPALSFAGAWLVGLKGFLLFAAGIALAPVCALVVALLVGLLNFAWPPQLIPWSPPPRPLTYLPGYRALPWNRPIVLGLSDPPPLTKPEQEPRPDSDAAPPEAPGDQRRA